MGNQAAFPKNPNLRTSFSRSASTKVHNSLRRTCPGGQAVSRDVKHLYLGHRDVPHRRESGTGTGWASPAKVLFGISWDDWWEMVVGQWRIVVLEGFWFLIGFFGWVMGLLLFQRMGVLCLGDWWWCAFWVLRCGNFESLTIFSVGFFWLKCHVWEMYG